MGLCVPIASLGLLVALSACSGDSPVPSESPTLPASASGSPPSPPAGTRATRSQAALDQALREAAWAGDVTEARRLIAEGADVNAKDDTEQSAYLIATSEGHYRLLELTLANGARLNDKDSYNGTGLIRAAERGHAFIVGRLLQAGIDRDHVNRLGYQAIHEAVWLGEPTAKYVDTVRVLFAGGVQFDRPSAEEGLTPREMAESKGHDGQADAIDRMAAARVDQPDRALLEAARSGDADRAAAAIRAGARLETRDERRRTPLLLAVTGDHLPVIRLLVALGADPDAVDDQSDTPWLVTGVTGSVAAAEVLLRARPDLTLVNRFGGVSIIPASERGHVEYVRRVVRTGIDVDHVNRLGWTALLEAVILGDGGPRHQEIVEILLDAGADPSIADADGVTALQHARNRGYDEIVRLLEEAARGG